MGPGSPRGRGNLGVDLPHRKCMVTASAPQTGPDLMGEANWAIAQGPPQLRGIHKKQ